MTPRGKELLIEYAVRDRPDVPGVSYVTRTHLRIGT